MLTAEKLISVCPAAAPYALELIKQAAEAGIMANPNRGCIFLGQICVESQGFEAVVESLNYRANSDAMKRFIRWGRISSTDAEKFGKTPEHPANRSALANILYGGEWGKKNLGNTEAGDGWRFRGRGLKQLTGRDNYRRFSKSWLGDESLLTNPDRVAESDGAVASAIWFWGNKKLNAVADRGNVAEVTKLVNGGDMGLADRIRWTETFRKVWGPDFSGVTARVL